MRQIILASASPRRQELMKLITADFQIKVPEFDESALKEAGLPPEELVRALAKGKALAARSQFGGDAEALYVGGDTVVLSPDGEAMGKPKDRADARRMLLGLSGRTHQVVTGVAIAWQDLIMGEKKFKTFTASTDVDFYPLSEKEVEAYLDTPEPYDKAGAYGIQERGGLFVKAIRGDYFNVVGLPVARLAKELQAL
ncbi:MAG: septum formation protein Maf [Oscillospiraceae bacterium]|jgi:septum formation protein|nr:septum formation protein Maf [Oscillospiraceae bacterium]